MSQTLYHYTCDDTFDIVGAVGELIPSPMTGTLWLTDLDAPVRAGLGLTSNSLKCDRTKHRYKVILDGEHAEAGIVPWHEVRKVLDPNYVSNLEGPGALPMHWFVSAVPQRAVHDCPRCQPRDV